MIVSMPRRPRVSTGGYAFHVLNRAVGRSTLFETQADFLAFEQVLADVHRRLPTRLLGYVLMPNHFHLVLWPEADRDLSEFMRLVTVTHTQRWHAFHQSSGTGPLYQGRFKSFPIQRDEHLLTVLRYVERNALRAKLSKRAEDWRWSSLYHHLRDELPAWLLPLNEWPLDRRSDWLSWVNRPQGSADEQILAECIRRSRPFGSERWLGRTVKELSLESTLHNPGRPRLLQK
jgi:putative transposase